MVLVTTRDSRIKPFKPDCALHGKFHLQTRNHQYLGWHMGPSLNFLLELLDAWVAQGTSTARSFLGDWPKVETFQTSARWDAFPDIPVLLRIVQFLDIDENPVVTSHQFRCFLAGFSMWEVLRNVVDRPDPCVSASLDEDGLSWSSIFAWLMTCWSTAREWWPSNQLTWSPLISAECLAHLDTSCAGKCSWPLGYLFFIHAGGITHLTWMSPEMMTSN